MSIANSMVRGTRAPEERHIGDNYVPSLRDSNPKCLPFSIDMPLLWSLTFVILKTLKRSPRVHYLLLRQNLFILAGVAQQCGSLFNLAVAGGVVLIKALFVLVALNKLIG
jgi:hypothetical protein